VVPNTLPIQQYNSRISFTEDNKESCKQAFRLKKRHWV